MDERLRPGLGIAILLAIAVTFGVNHVLARVAFDHGASVTVAASARAMFTALFLLCLLKLWNVPIGMPRAMFVRGLLVGALLAMQSFCLFSAVALIPVALALLVFQICPMLYMLLSWATRKDAPGAGVLAVMPLALVGLAFALDVRIEDFWGRWAQIGVGVGWAFGAAIAYALVLFLNVHWLEALDGRVRTFVVMAVSAVLILVGGTAADSLVPPVDATGWLAIAALTLLYGIAITSLFVVLPRLGSASSTVALNFEPIAVLGVAWLVLGQTVSALQVVGAFVVVGAIAWLGLMKR